MPHAFALLALTLGALAPSPLAAPVPIGIDLGHGASPLDGALVHLCELDWAAYKRDPPAFPMSRDLEAASGCDDSTGGKRNSISFLELEREYAASPCAAAPGTPGCAPDGLVFHQSRCGSTLVANLLAALPDSVSYSESKPPMDVVMADGLSEGDKVRALRVIVAAMGRPIRAGARAQGGGGAGQGAGRHSASSALASTTAAGADAATDSQAELQAALASVSTPSWAPSRLYFKLQSAQSAHIGLWRAAFPSSPWLFVHRQGVEILASLFRGPLNAPPPDAPADQSVGGTVARLDGRLSRIPCLRSVAEARTAVGGAGVSATDQANLRLLMTVTGVADPAGLLQLTPEAYCAGQVGTYAAVAAGEVVRARVAVLRQEAARLGGSGGAAGGADASMETLVAAAMDGRAFAAALAGAGGASTTGAATTSTGAVDAHPAAPTVPGVVAGMGLGLPLDYPSLPGSAIEAIGSHFSVPLSPALQARLLAVAGRYSKARIAEGAADAGASNSGGSGVAALAAAAGIPRGIRASAAKGKGQGSGGGWVGPDRASPYKDDSEDKQAAAWPLLRSAAAAYAGPFHSLLLALAGHPEAAAEGAAAGAAGLDPSAVVAPPRLPHDRTWRDLQLPLGKGYPALFPLGDILTAWSADIVTPPPDYGSFSSLRVFDWRDMDDRTEAEEYRRAEVPFIVSHVPALDATSALWSEDSSLLQAMGGPGAIYEAEVNVGGSNHFMYWNKAKARKSKGYTPPTREARVTAGEWLRRAHEVAAAVVEEEKQQLPAWWIENGGLGVVEGKVAASSISSALKLGGPVLLSEPKPPLLTALRQDKAEDKDKTHAASKADTASSPASYLPPLPPSRAERELVYMRASTDQANAAKNSWIHAALSFVAPDGVPGASDPARPFFLVDAKQQRGIHCRFGQPGIIAEAHYDAGRNFITMERGHKRYILAPPSECENLGLLKDGPSARHSGVDWSDPTSWGETEPLATTALGLEVVLSPGQALYVPALWFHYIISLDVNVQCNTRSGTPPLYDKALAGCGFQAPVTEALGAHTDPNAQALQPDRTAHLPAWRALWPEQSLDGPLGPSGKAGPKSYAAQVRAALAMRVAAGGGAGGASASGSISIGSEGDGAAAGDIAVAPVAGTALRLLLAPPDRGTAGGTGAPGVAAAAVGGSNSAAASAVTAAVDSDALDAVLTALERRWERSRSGQAAGGSSSAADPSRWGAGRSGSVSARDRTRALAASLRGSSLWVAALCLTLVLGVAARAMGCCRPNPGMAASVRGRTASKTAASSKAPPVPADGALAVGVRMGSAAGGLAGGAGLEGRRRQ